MKKSTEKLQHPPGCLVLPVITLAPKGPPSLFAQYDVNSIEVVVERETEAAWIGHSVHRIMTEGKFELASVSEWPKFAWEEKK